MEKQTGPRRRVLTLRVKRDVYYRLTYKASAAGLPLDEYVYRHIVALAFDHVKVVMPDQQSEVSNDV